MTTLPDALVSTIDTNYSGAGGDKPSYIINLGDYVGRTPYDPTAYDGIVVISPEGNSTRVNFNDNYDNESRLLYVRVTSYQSMDRVDEILTEVISIIKSNTVGTSTGQKIKGTIDKSDRRRPVYIKELTVEFFRLWLTAEWYFTGSSTDPNYFFKTISAITGDVVATEARDTLTLSSTSGIVDITGDAVTKTLNFDVPYVDQDVKQAASPTFADLTLSAPSNIYSLDHDSFSGFVANEHIDHSTVSVIAGTGMSGGGTLEASRTLNCDITQYTDALAEDVIAADCVDGQTIDNAIDALIATHTAVASAHHTKYALTDDLAAGEISQLQNIDATTISAAQWGYLGGTNQGIATTNSPTFAGLTLVNAINEFSIDGTFADNSDSAVPTEKATKTYVGSYWSNNCYAWKATLTVNNSTDGADAYITEAGYLFFYSDLAKTNQTAYIQASTGKIVTNNELRFSTTTEDTNLYRSAANTLKTDDAFIAVGNITAANFVTSGNVDGVDVSAHAASASSHHTKYALTDDLAAGEISQLQNINAVTISNAQWGYLGELDQSIKQSATPTFDNLSLTGNSTVTGGNYLRLQSSTQYVQLISAASQHQYFDAGGYFYWRDKDSSNATRMSLDSSNGYLSISNGLTYSSTLKATSSTVNMYTASSALTAILANVTTDYCGSVAVSGVSLDVLNYISLNAHSTIADKQNIALTDRNAIASELDGLEAKTFEFKLHPDKTKIGFIAQDMPARLQSFDKDGNVTGYSMDGLVAMMYCKMLAQDERIAKLEAGK